MFENCRGAMVAQPCECSKCHWVVHFKIANFILCEYHLNTLFLKTHLLQNCSIIKLAWLRCFIFSAHLSLLKAVCRSQFYTFILKCWCTIVSFCSVIKLCWFAFSKKVKTFLGGGVPGKNKSDSILDLFFLLEPLCSVTCAKSCWLCPCCKRMLPVAWNIQDSPFSRLWSLKV